MPPSRSVTDGWLVVCRPDGIIEGVAGGAPREWVGIGVDEAFVGHPELLDVLPRLLDESVPGTCVHRVRAVAMWHGEPIDVELLLMESLPIRRAHVPLEPLFVATLDVLAAQARSAAIELRIQFEPQLPTVAVIDPEKIGWAVATLVGGALRHARAVDRSGELPRVTVQIGWDGSVDEIVVRVQDNGPGIPQSRARWLFDRDPATGKAAGLALVMVRDVAVAHRGSVSVESSLTTGTRFTLRFPRRV